MKVALVCDWYHPRVGGIELHLQDLARRLIDAGHDVVAITPTRGADVVDGVRVRRIDAPLTRHFNFMYTRAGVRALGEAMRDERIDVAHCHVSIISPAALGAAIQANGCGIPVLLTFHSVVPQTRLLARASGMLLGSARWRAKFSAVSERVAREVRPFAAGQTMVILRNGIDVDYWRVQPRRRVSRTVELISVMRLNAKKRPLVLVDTVRRVNELLPSSEQVHLRIVGDGPLRSQLEHASLRAGLGPQIELLGHRTREQIRELFAESDIFVLPTVRESFGLAALEARCAGLPVIAMAGSGVAEFVRHGRDGLLARSDLELGTHVATLSRDVDRRESIARHNQNLTPPFDWPRTLDAHLALYREAIALRESV